MIVSNGISAEASDDELEPTVDGERLELGDLNIGSGEKMDAEPDASPMRRVLKALSLFTAGMYTGVKCGGTPHSHHSYRRDRDDGPI